ncbi:hypothetical protein LOK74_12230 [Brevibacillus humidisoli]|nr:hypothetical protein [Brevibacillus humidisoli]UFJ38857.1 hypothetical protein LOK74_12230 [Brevibacillus humidisoli]
MKKSLLSTLSLCLGLALAISNPSFAANSTQDNGESSQTVVKNQLNVFGK